MGQDGKEEEGQERGGKGVVRIPVLPIGKCYCKHQKRPCLQKPCVHCIELYKLQLFLLTSKYVSSEMLPRFRARHT